MINLILLTFIRLIFFLLLSFFIFYLPGRLILGKWAKKLRDSEIVSLSLTLGIVFFVSLGVIVGVLKLRFLSLPILFFLAIVSIWRYRLDILSPWKKILTNKIFLLLVLLGILIQGLINFPSGFLYKEGILFWSSQGHDGLWHVALMEEIKHHFPPGNPLYPGQPMRNYHYASDILMGEFYRILPFFSSLDLYFRFFPVIFSFLIGITTFSFANRKWGESVAYWSMFFAYFCGSFGYVYLILKGRFPLGGETTFWASQNNTILGNPPHTIGIILMTSFFLAFYLWLKERKGFWLLIGFFLVFGLSTFKVSTGATVIMGLFGCSLIFFLRERKFLFPIYSVFLALTNFLLLKVVSPAAESFLLFEPLWFPRTMMVVRLDSLDWELRRQHYMWVDTWKSWLRVIQLETQALLIFIIGNTGMRMIGFWAAIKQLFKRKENLIDIFLISAMTGSLLVPIFFVQSGITYNLIQFMQIYFHILGFYAALSVVQLLKKINKSYLKIIIAVFIIILAIPTAVGSIFDFYGPGRFPLAKVTNQELEALDWLKDNSDPEDLVLTKPFDGDAKYRYQKQPWPISAWYSTPYVFVFSDRYVFLSGEEQLNITRYDIDKDLSRAKKFFAQEDLVFNRNFLKESKIDFIYLRKDEIDRPVDKEENNIVQIYSNEEVVIYGVLLDKNDEKDT